MSSTNLANEQTMEDHVSSGEVPSRERRGDGQWAARWSALGQRARRARVRLERVAKPLTALAFVVAVAGWFSVHFPAYFEATSFLWPWTLWVIVATLGPVTVALMLALAVEKLCELGRGPRC